MKRKLYRYQGLLVQVTDGRLEPVRRFGQVVPASEGPRGIAPLPKRLRRAARELGATA